MIYHTRFVELFQHSLAYLNIFALIAHFLHLFYVDFSAFLKFVHTLNLVTRVIYIISKGSTVLKIGVDINWLYLSITQYTYATSTAEYILRYHVTLSNLT